MFPVGCAKGAVGGGKFVFGCARCIVDSARDTRETNQSLNDCIKAWAFPAGWLLRSAKAGERSRLWRITLLVHGLLQEMLAE